jgi:hypothetical protein
VSIPSWSDVDVTFGKNTMITVSFNGTRESLINLLPKGKKMDSVYFTQSIIDPLVELRCSDSRQMQAKMNELLISVFEEWVRGLETCCDIEGD